MLRTQRAEASAFEEPSASLRHAYRAYLEHVRDHPVRFTQFNPAALTLLAERVSEHLTPEQFNACVNLAGPQSSQGWSGVRAGEFDYPRDHGPHPDIRDEWYYLAGNFFDAAGEGPISIVYSSRRRGLVPPSMWPGAAPGAGDVLLQQLAVTIPSDGVHTNSLKYQLGIDTPVEFAAEPFVWRFGGQGLKSLGPSLFPMEFAAEDDEVEVRLELNLSAQGSGTFPQGRNGCAPCISGLGYRYYTWPILHATGTLLHKPTRALRTLEGTMWMDHQWGARLAPFGYLDCLLLRAWMAVRNQIEPYFPRWNWFFFHLLEGGEVTDAVTTVKIPADGVEHGRGPFPLTHTTSVDARLNYRSRMGGGTVEAGEFLRNPISGALYPHGWTLALDDMTLKLEPTLRDQFIGTPHDVGVWEGGVTVTGTRDGRPVRGYGFAEVMAYEEPDQLVGRSLELLGIDPSHAPLFRPVPFSRWRRVAGALVLTLPLAALAGGVAMLWRIGAAIIW